MAGLNVYCFALLSSLVGLVSGAPVVQTPVGVLQGVDKNTPTTKTPYHVYYGIPYAAAPVGDLRFKAPQPFTSDDASAVLTSNNYKPACPQFSTYPLPMNEDCLFLNIFTPSTGGANFDVNAKKKVLVFIHGGAFMSGDTSPYSMSRVSADYDLIVVTIQYRLGALGFMSTGTSTLPGNYGLRDQIFALQWVKDNIAKFGGDPDDVTLSGESAGSTSCSMITISPLAKGLFTRVILMSGSAVAPWAIDTAYRRHFEKLARSAKCLPVPRRPNCDNEIVECLRKTDAMEIINLIAKDSQISPENVFSLDGYMRYAPVVDGEVLPKDPFELLQDADYLKEVGALDREYLIGVDNNEAMTFALNTLFWNPVVPMANVLNIDDPAAKKIVRNNLKTVFPHAVTKDTFDLVAKQYFNPRDANGQVDLQTAVNLMSDTDFVVPAILYAEYLVAASDSVKVFFFLFDNYPPLRVPDFPLKGSNHGAELIYLMDEDGPGAMFIYWADFFADECIPVIGITRGVMTNFVKSGNPSMPGTITWPRYEKSSKKYVAIDATPEVRSNLYQARVSLWTIEIPKVLGMTKLVRGFGAAHPTVPGVAPGQA